MTADETTLAGRIGDTARNIGFFYMTGHGIDPALIAAVFAGARRFFALPAEVKLR
jgi:isopenicillin N synthase-like dioxygenase